MTTATQPLFRFDRETHVYTLDGEEIPHVTGMLEQAGYLSDVYYHEEGAERGQIVHALTAEYDLGAIPDPSTVVSKYKGWLDAHVAAMRVLRPTITAVEEAVCSYVYRYGTRPDRVWTFKGMRCLVDLKTGGPEQWHPYQLALQAIAVGQLPPEAWRRYCLYLKDNGRWRLVEYSDRRDFDVAHNIIREACQ